MNTIPLFLQELTTPDIPEDTTNNITKLVEETGFTCTYCRNHIVNYNLIALYTHPEHTNIKFAILTSLCPRCNQLHIFFVSLLEIVPNYFVFETSPIHIEAEALNTLHFIQKQFLPPNYETCTPLQYLQAIRNNILIYLAYTVFLNKSTKKFLQDTINNFSRYKTTANISLNTGRSTPAEYNNILSFLNLVVFLYPNNTILSFITKTISCTPTQFKQYFKHYFFLNPLDKLK